jgi:quercetin dioxygenase-like cupin family protein
MKAWPLPVRLAALGDRLAALGDRLAERARHSVQAHREYHTLRREDQIWAAAGAGCSQTTLWQGASARIQLLRLEAGAALPWPADATAQEVLLVQGRVATRAADGDTLLQPYAYALRAAPDAGTLIARDGPALLYVRQMLVEPSTLPEPEGQWWRLERAALQIVLPEQHRWRPTFPGVEVLPLWGNPAVTSMLVRFAAGAGVPDHHHAVPEDCLMLEGEMFLGDILLRPGDYQLAPAGGSHFGEMSDVGGTFFFHGAIDPVLVPPRAT